MSRMNFSVAYTLLLRLFFAQRFKKAVCQFRVARAASCVCLLRYRFVFSEDNIAGGQYV
jgi:hypothetical protein